MLRRVFVGTVLVFTALLLGCGKLDDKDRRYPVKVTVSLDGKPLPDGQIDFVPLDARSPGTGLIKDGKA